MGTNRCDEIVRLIDEVLADYEHASYAAAVRSSRCRETSGQRPTGQLAVGADRRHDGLPAWLPVRRAVAGREGGRA